MNEEIKNQIGSDPDGLLTYEYMANNIATLDDNIEDVVENMIQVDRTGQFTVSAARYLNAIDHEHFAPQVDRLIAAAIEKDREHRYIADLLTIWGSDYAANVDTLIATDNNFRRIYKRLYQTGI